MLIVHYGKDGQRLDDTGEAPEALDHIEAVATAWRIYNLTGDRTRLVELGILPARNGATP